MFGIHFTEYEDRKHMKVAHTAFIMLINTIGNPHVVGISKKTQWT